jgi:hypothetical protein
MWMSSVRPAIILVSLLTAVPLLCWGQTQGLNLDQILSRMDQVRAAERDRAIPYTVTREYQLASEGAEQADSHVVARVNVVPPASKDYIIVQSDGSDRGQGIVRKVLDHETSMATHADTHIVNRANYDISLMGRESLDGHDCYVLQLVPRREAVELVRGKAWVDTRDFQIRRIAGQTAKNPSFWIKNLNVTLNYGEVNGIWVQTFSKAVADLRLVGPHVLTSREVEVRPATFNARSQSPAKAHRQPPNNYRRVAEPATWVGR